MSSVIIFAEKPNPPFFSPHDTAHNRPNPRSRRLLATGKARLCRQIGEVAVLSSVVQVN
jgi:hypothetical protein